jgi:hypothetical protein
LVNVTENVPGDVNRLDEAKAELLLTTLWKVEPVFVQTTVSPTLFVRNFGWKAKPTILTKLVAAPQGMAADARMIRTAETLACRKGMGLQM